MNAYCDRSGLATAAVRFRFDGQPINEADTPLTLEMEEGDTIEVYQQQTGGGPVWTTFISTNLIDVVVSLMCKTKETYFI